MKGGLMTAKLAIVIPVYKIDYFEYTLASIASQTVGGFNVYIGNDCSTFQFEDLIRNYPQLNISYKRFEDNLGKNNLVKQWERCIAMSNNEPWVWLFSDDDVMAPTCVENFYKKLETTKQWFNVYKFKTAVINDAGIIIEPAKELPEVISGFDLISKKIRGDIKTYVTDYIFSRFVYDNLNGFENFPLAWGADDATWVKFAAEKGIQTIPGDGVCWRTSSQNISNIAYEGKKNKVLALLMYSKWNIKNFSDHPFVKVLTKELRTFFFDQLYQYQIPFSPIFHIRVFLKARQLWTFSLWSYFRLIIRHK
jgi:glycosyltransferase involved in cell wall biosynthesis